MTSIPSDFVAEAERAAAVNDLAHLKLQSLEVEGLAWEFAGKAFIEKIYPRNSVDLHIDRAVLFSGHFIDAPARESPRFPPAAEPIARHAIQDFLMHEQEQGEVTGISGGANGGDILFLETCRALNIPFKMLLVVPELLFVEESVAPANSDWVKRFEELTREVHPSVLADSLELPAWLHTKNNYSIWERNNLWMVSAAIALSPARFTVAALWDGKKGDGPGGTENMVRTAQRHGAKFTHLDTQRLFFGDPAIHTARP